MTNFDRSQHPTLNDNLDFRKDLAKLLQKYNAEIVSEHDEDISFIIKGVGCYPLNEKGANCANAENINGLEEKPKKKRQRKRREKNPLRRWIYEYNRYNPQLGCSVRKAEVYAKTRKEAERTAKRHCDDYTAYGSLSFKRIIQVSEPITLGIDVTERVRHYDDLHKSYNEFEEVYGNHTEAFNNLHDITEAD